MIVYNVIVIAPGSISFGGTTLFIDLYILPISRADVVLGIQRLKTLSPIFTNIKVLQCNSTGWVILLTCKDYVILILGKFLLVSLKEGKMQIPFQHLITLPYILLTQLIT